MRLCGKPLLITTVRMNSLKLLLVPLFMPFWAVAQVTPSFTEERFLRIEKFTERSHFLTSHYQPTLPLFSYVLNGKYATTERVTFFSEKTRN
jgi:hypothetical protein